MTLCQEVYCMAFAYLSIMCAPGEPRITSPLVKWHVGLKENAEEGTILDRHRYPK